MAAGLADYAALIVFPPVGIVLFWISKRFNVAPKIISTVIFALGFLIILGNLGGGLFYHDPRHCR